MRHLFISCTLCGLGAALGVQVFFQRTPYLIEQDGGFYIQDAAPYTAVGAIAGQLIAEGLLSFLANRDRRKEAQRLQAAIHNEAALQGLTLEQQAVLLEAVRRLEEQRHV
jgi:hypothetical protein